MLIKEQSKEIPFKHNNWFKNSIDSEIPIEVVQIASLDPNFIVAQKMLKQDVIETIKNLESTVSSNNISDDLKN